jgi:hypothetical protein
LRVFKTRTFARFARKERISDDVLRDAVRRAQRGLVDADLGGGVIKQRAARPGEGRSGGYRLLVAYRRNFRATFLYGFAKSERDDIDEDELETARDIAKGWLNAGIAQITRSVEEGLLQEIAYEGTDEEND